MKQKTLFCGSATALITPFTEDGIDFDALERLLEFQIENKTDALVICGTTGEPATMTYEERDKVVAFALRVVRGRVPVIVGTGANATQNAIATSRRAADAGADALLVVTPFYNKCTQEGLFQHYKAVCETTDLPVICYNVPGRTGVNILPETLKRMAEIKTLSAIKEASGSLDQITEMASLVGDALDIYSGDDGLTLPILSVGGKGVISVASNIAPRAVHDLCADFFAGKINEARAMQCKLYPLVKALFCEVNPIPVKTAASLMGFGQCHLRLPLCDMSEAHRRLLENEMRSFGLNF